jgi:SagB-type dehydrogenase family enzyme
LPRGVGPDPAYASLYSAGQPPHALTIDAVGDFLRCALGLSAWKSYRGTRWALRVNPSSGNLHPTEAYAVWDGGVFHYAADAHALEERARLPADAWPPEGLGAPAFLVGLTSVHWREAWKYGSRAFRYCQHDVGHAIAALRLSAAMRGWHLALLPRWSDADIAALLGLDANPGAGEPEAPDCLAVVTAGAPGPWRAMDPAPLVAAAHRVAWVGVPNWLSPAHVEWPEIEAVADAARYPGTASVAAPSRVSPAAADTSDSRPAREVILRRRSAVAFDPRVGLPLDAFLTMLRRTRPHGVPWDAIDWPPQVHLVLFVHRVDGLVPGVYAWLRDDGDLDALRAAMRPEFLWESVHGLHLLLPTDVRWVANRLSCDQDIASDGCFSLGMLARFEAPLEEWGDWFYRRLFWECGLIGQVLYLEAETAGVRGTGIGCFYDDRVHEALGLSGHAWQSLYHFSMGAPLDDTRLTTEPGYAWEKEVG